MLAATKTAVKTVQNTPPDRLAHAKNFANELSNSRLRKTKRRWTDVERGWKAALIRHYRPWKHSTGPKSSAGKAASALNAVKSGLYGREWKEFHAVLAAQRLYVRLVLLAHGKDWPADPFLVLRRMVTMDDLLRRLRTAMEKAGIETSALDARILVRQGGNFSDADLITMGQAPLSGEVVEKIGELLNRRLAGEPVSRLLGEREFWGLSFKVTPDTLDPRPDTETLVEAALKRAAFIGGAPAKQVVGGADKGHRSTGNKPLRVLDLGTGSGCILISLLHELPDATGVAVDINPGAIAVARENAVRNGVDSRIDFRVGSWFEPIAADESFDLIVSNPPYIPESDIESLAKEVRNHDPMLALSGGNDGLDAYKIILMNIKNHLACGGFALFEIGKGQEKDLARLVADSNMNREESYADLGGILRVVEITHGEN